MMENNDKTTTQQPTPTAQKQKTSYSQSTKNNTESEYLKMEQEYDRKEKAKAYYKEKERKQEERIDKIEKMVLQMSESIEKLVDIKEKKYREQKEKEKIDYYNSFEGQIELLHNERMREEERKRYDINYVGDMQYSLFCCWCNAYRAVVVPGIEGTIDMEQMKKTSYVNDKYFREYYKEIVSFKQKLPDDAIKKYIAEKYFGYEYYRDDNGNLRARKIKEILQ